MTGKDAHLHKGAQVQGTVSDAASGAGSYELVFSPEFNEFAAGDFVLPEEDGYRTQYYSGAADRSEANPLALSAPATASVDAHLLSTHESALPDPLPPPLSPSVTPVIDSGPAAKKRPKKCKRGFKKRKVKGIVRCVKVHKHKHQRRGKRGGA